jgi:cation transport regulator ChaC
MLYFAYGSNMDPVQMAERTPGGRSLGAARLDGWRLTFTRDSPAWGGGVGHIERAPDDEVWGVLWDLTTEHLNALDEYEGVELGAYVRDRCSVAFEGHAVEADVYIAVPRGFKRPSHKYLSAMIRGAEAHGLPQDYVESLRALMP